MSYPKMLYHPSGKAVVVASEAEHARLPEWASTPFTDTCSQAPDVVRFVDVEKAAPTKFVAPPQYIGMEVAPINDAQIQGMQHMATNQFQAGATRQLTASNAFESPYPPIQTEPAAASAVPKNKGGRPRKVA